jgi:SAM-dependent methyltransferase
MSDFAPTKRFSERVDNYVKYRPSYPTAVLDCLKAECGLTETAVIADIGSGTGLLCKLFLDNGNRVYGVEPNKEMREAGERLLGNYANFKSVNGTAEATTLPDHSLDFVTAGQAAHWFEPAPAYAEFQRILKPGGVIALVWNTRDLEASPFMREYEAIQLKYGRDDSGWRLLEGGHERGPERILGDGAVYRSFTNQQIVDYEGLEGRTISSSMMPLPGQPTYTHLLLALRELFDRYQEDGRVTIHYLTELFYAKSK